MDTLSYKTASANKETANKQWLLVDAEGKNLGRLASEVASLLRGKHKPTFAPHMDTGDFVIVINAGEIALTGSKNANKIAFRHSGYPGGLTATTYADMMVTHPTRAVEKAVRGMLPKNSLGRSQITKLKVYAGAEHDHQAQQPKVLELLASK